nr:GNAT family N-acetyltransferase [Actinomycetota bacterium]
MTNAVDNAAFELPAGFELDPDPDRIQIDELHSFLSEESYWAKGRARTEVERLVRTATMVVGLYARGQMVGFARAVSDGTAFAYLADVYVLDGFRGQGLGLQLVRFVVDDPRFEGRRWLLHTKDAHGLYRKLGFTEPSPLT